MGLVEDTTPHTEEEGVLTEAEKQTADLISVDVSLLVSHFKIRDILTIS